MILSNPNFHFQLLDWLPYSGDSVLLSGGRQSYTGYLSSAVLYPEGCSVPDLDGVLQHHTTFLTQEPTPRIAACGGSSNSYDVLKECWVLQGGAWRSGLIEDLPTGRKRSASARLEDGVFLMGGVGDDRGSVFLRAGSSSWQQGPDLPSVMHWGPCAAPISAHSFLIVYATDVYEFDSSVAGPTSQDGWQAKETWPQLQEHRKNWPGCGVVNGKFVIAGGLGDDDHFKARKTTEIIDLRSKTIEFAGEMSKTRMEFHLLPINGVLFALAGNGYVPENNAHTYIMEVEEFVEESRTWKPATSLPSGRNNHGGVALNKELVCGPGICNLQPDLKFVKILHNRIFGPKLLHTKKLLNRDCFCQ